MPDGSSGEFDEDGIELPYEGEDRCPRTHIHEDPFWWADLINHYDAYKNGVLPNEGGLSDQPALFLPIMSLISNAIAQEKEFAEQDKKRMDAMIEQSQRSTGQKSGPVSLLNGGGGQYAPISVPGKK